VVPSFRSSPGREKKCNIFFMVILMEGAGLIRPRK
jgi:hypothetical protein